jgi:hypothetical protein
VKLRSHVGDVGEPAAHGGEVTDGQPKRRHHCPERQAIRKGRFEVCLTPRAERINQVVDVGRDGCCHVDLHLFGGEGPVERLPQLPLPGAIGAEHGLTEGVFEQ